MTEKAGIRAGAQSIAGSSWLPWVALIATCGLLGMIAGRFASLAVALLVAVVVGIVVGLLLRAIQRWGRATDEDRHHPEM